MIDVSEVTHADDEQRHVERKTWRERTVGRKLRGWYNKYDFSTEGIGDNQLESTVYCLNSDVDAAWSVYSTLLSYDCFSDDYVKGVNAASDAKLALKLLDSAYLVVESIGDAMRDNVDCTGFIKVSYQPKLELVKWWVGLNTKIQLQGDTVQDAERFEKGLKTDIVKLNDIATRYAKMLAEVCATTDLTNLGQ